MSYVGERSWQPIQCPKKEESERLRGEGDQAKFIDIRFDRGQVVGFMEGRKSQDVPRTACSWDE